jgi:hypothetical protein
MKRINTFLLIILIIASCKQKETTQPESIETQPSADSTTLESTDADVFAPQNDWDYQTLYGIYLHESNTQGFTAILEILPQGNDLTFSLSLEQNNCTGKAEGSIGMAIHTETEYAGFFDNPDCRMEFIFNLKQQSIRLQEVGFCRLHENGCDFSGVYIKKR